MLLYRAAAMPPRQIDNIGHFFELGKTVEVERTRRKACTRWISCPGQSPHLAVGLISSDTNFYQCLSAGRADPLGNFLHDGAARA